MDLSAENLDQGVWVYPRAPWWGILEMEMRRVISGVAAGSVVTNEVADGHRQSPDDTFGK